MFMATIQGTQRNNAPDNDETIIGAAGGTREVLVADAALEDLQTLLQGLRPGVEPRLMQGGQDAIAFIRDALAIPGLRTLHLVGHGAAGTIHLGGREISAADFPHASAATPATPRDLDIALWSCQ